ncbi:hypothetical protein [Galbitalea soli]|uniref:Uncharacterized protein n=1 Tax=Galbitalea soli TaxID=1268042 RepID=A0A7C9PLN5_9MICO|nr:hypothetical protein [Galbitalea soli]NEM90373.1 hypothetical protein [Galbitalea soli]NYJ31083.1 membrane glycosyltransferase [Galbitalea soli]
MLPLSLSVVLDGIVYAIRHRGPRLLLFALVLSAVIAGLGYLAWRNGMMAMEGTEMMVFAPDSMSGTIELFLVLSIPVAVLGFGIRMISLFLNPLRREQERVLIEARAARRRERAERRQARARQHVATPH